VSLPEVHADRHRGERGVSMIFTLLSLSMVTLVGLTLASVGLSSLGMATAESETSEALSIADAGIEHAKQLVLYQDWPDLNVFLQRGNGTHCDADELEDVPNGPLPLLYPPAGSGAANFIPRQGRVFAQGRYFVALCDNHTVESSRPIGSPYYNTQPNVDADKVIYARSVGYGPRGSRAAVELTLGAAAMPAVVVEGNLEVKGNPTVTGPAGSIHANGELELSGNPCTHVYYASTGGTVESGNVQGGANCTANDVDSRPFSPPINIPRYTPQQIAQWAVQEGRQVIRLKADGTVANWATGAPMPTPLNWNYSSGGNNITWSINAPTTPGILYIEANVNVGGNVSLQTAVPTNPRPPVPLTLLVAGTIKATGTPRMEPGLSNATVPFTQTPLKYIGPVLFMAGHDLSLGADFTDETYQGLFYAVQQLDVAGNPDIFGQLIALNDGDTYYPTTCNNGNNCNPVPLQNGKMVISGNPTINYNGNGLDTVKALTWRECRNQPWSAPIVVTGGVIVTPGTPCGTP
jgi:hypothetical protein